MMTMKQLDALISGDLDAALTAAKSLKKGNRGAAQDLLAALDGLGARLRVVKRDLQAQVSADSFWASYRGDGQVADPATRAFQEQQVQKAAQVGMFGSN